MEGMRIDNNSPFPSKTLPIFMLLISLLPSYFSSQRPVDQVRILLRLKLALPAWCLHSTSGPWF